MMVLRSILFYLGYILVTVLWGGFWTLFGLFSPLSNTLSSNHQLVVKIRAVLVADHLWHWRLRGWAGTYSGKPMRRFRSP